MPASETPSYPARVVRYLSERRHALERGALARAAYDAEVERVFERVLDDTARGCATKILTVNALREANLCDEKTAARYVTLCVGAYRRGGAYSVDDVIEGTAIEGTAERTDLPTSVRSDAEPSEKTPAPPRASRTTFENTRWHLGPGGDPWAFAYDEDTHVMRELEYLAEKSRAMHERARRAAEARAGEASSAAAAEAEGASAETRGRRVELGDAAKDGSGADAGGAASGRSITDWDSARSERDETSTCEEPTRNAPSPRSRDPALEKMANAGAFGNVLARAATSARRAEAAARDVERFAAELEKKYPFPKYRDTWETSVPNLEDGVLASWDDVDPRRPGEAPVPVSVHWTDVDAREGGEGGDGDDGDRRRRRRSPRARRGGTDGGTDDAVCHERTTGSRVGRSSDTRGSRRGVRRGVRARRDRARRRKTRGGRFRARVGVAADRFRKRRVFGPAEFSEGAAGRVRVLRAAAPGADAPARRAERRRGGPRGSDVPVRARPGRPGPNAGPD
jgi:hypothetical protein